MSTDYGTDVLALDDVEDPEVLASGDLNVAYALARRLLTPTGALEEIGETEPYDSIDVREWLGNRFRLTDRSVLDDLQTQAAQVLGADPRVETVDSVVVTYAQGTLTLTARMSGAAGPFALILSVNGVSASLLRGG